MTQRVAGFNRLRRRQVERNVSVEERLGGGEPVRRHDEYGFRLNENRLAGRRVEHVGEKLFRLVDVFVIDQLVACQGVNPGASAGGIVRVVGRSVELVRVGNAQDAVENALFLVESQRLARFFRPAENEIGAVKENRLAGNRNDQAALDGFRRLGVLFRQSGVGVGHARRDFHRLVAQASDAGNLLAAKASGNRTDGFTQNKGFVLVRLTNFGENNLTGDVQKRCQVNAVGFRNDSA